MGEYLAEIVVVVLIVFILSLVAVVGWAQAATAQRCLAAGYRDSKVTYKLERYCIKRVDQTDVVVPLDVVEGKR